MKGFAIPLLGVIFVALISGSIQSTSADHLGPGEGIFSGEKDIELVTTEDSNYKIYLQAILRNGDGQLISVVESTANGAYIPHKFTDQIFDTLMGEKEIVTIDGIKYEKVQFYDSSTNKEGWDRGYTIGLWLVIWCDTDMLEEMISEQDELECLNIFQARTDQVIVKNEDVITAKWTILRAVN